MAQKNEWLRRMDGSFWNRWLRKIDGSEEWMAQKNGHPISYIDGYIDGSEEWLYLLSEGIYTLIHLNLSVYPCYAYFTYVTLMTKKKGCTLQTVQPSQPSIQ